MQSEQTASPLVLDISILQSFTLSWGFHKVAHAVLELLSRLIQPNLSTQRLAFTGECTVGHLESHHKKLVFRKGGRVVREQWEGKNSRQSQSAGPQHTACDTDG